MLRSGPGAQDEVSRERPTQAVADCDDPPGHRQGAARGRRARLARLAAQGWRREVRSPLRLPLQRVRRGRSQQQKPVLPGAGADVMEPAAIVASAFDLDVRAREFSREHVQYQDGERALQSAEKRTESLREEQRRRRIALGNRLIEDKARIKHGGWLPYLEKLGIEQRTASNWMREAGYLEGKSESSGNDSDLNPRVAAGIDKRPRKRDEEPDEPPQREAETRPATPEAVEEPNLFASWKRDISRALVGLDKMIMGYAKSWPKRSRSDLASALRSVADRIESMTGD